MRGFTALEEAGITAVHELERDLHRWIADVLLPEVARIQALDRLAQHERATQPIRTPPPDRRLAPQDQWLLRQGAIYLQGWDAHPGLLELIAQMQSYLRTNHGTAG